MPVRIHLHTLGDARITVGGKEVSPSSPMVFAALLYFCLERGRRVPRTALQELLFPETDERSGAHSVRQLLYKLRQLGVPLLVNDTALELEASCVTDDFPGDDAVAADHTLLARLSAGLLPSYEPRVSAAFDRWLDEQRTRAATRARTAMLKAMTGSQDAGDHVAMESIASALLKLDPLNETATLVRAGVLAITGQKYDALRMLERYSAEVGTSSPQLRVQPDLLRRRIAERFHASDRASVPMLGRQEELAFLLAQFARANDGHGTASIVWGDAGIGKTRLVEEFGAHLVLKNAHVDTARCQPFDRERPLGALVDLVPKLLHARGALGVSPDSLLQLRRLSGEIPPDEPKDIPPELTSTRIREAIGDLVLCVAAERPLVLVVEDAHWLDEASLRLLLGLVPGQDARLLLVITMRDRPRFPAGVRISESVLVRQLVPLNDVVSADLLARTVGSEFTLDENVREQCVTMAAGNPLFICTVAEHLRLRGAAPSAKAGIEDLLKQRIRILDGPTLLLLRTIAALGNHTTLERLRACTGLSVDVELLGLQELADRGLIVRQEGSIRCAHDVLTEVVLSDAPEAIRISLYERVATVLEEDGTAGKQVQLLWSCAESWLLAGNAQRAFHAFIKCADFAEEIGQPTFACLMLEKAQVLTQGKELLRVVGRTALLAERSGDAQRVLDNAYRYRELSAQIDAPPNSADEIDVALSNVLRWQSKASWTISQRLREIVVDPSAQPDVRLRAARSYLAAAEQELRRAEAVELFATVSDLKLQDKAPAAFAHFVLVYQTVFGELSHVATCASEIERRISALGEWQQCAALSNLAIAWFRAGEIDRSLDCNHRAIAIAERCGFTFLTANIASSMTATYFTAGDLLSAAKWHSFNEKQCQKSGASPSAAYLANSIDFALISDDLEMAQLRWRALRAGFPKDTPYNRRFAVAYDLIVHDRVASEAPFHRLLAELAELYSRGRQASEHDFCAYALAAAMADRGDFEAAARHLDEYTSLARRDRHPVSPLLARLFERATSRSRSASSY